MSSLYVRYPSSGGGVSSLNALTGAVTLAAGTGISITPAGSTLTIAATGGTGTVTSVAMSVPAFLSVAGSPITTSGTLAVTLSGTALPIANGGTAGTTANGAFNNLSPLTTKGDLIGFSTVNARLGVGTDGQILVSDSASTLGIKWAAPSGTTFPILAPSGSVAAPSYSFAIDSTSGMTYDGVGFILKLITNGTTALSISSTQAVACPGTVQSSGFLTNSALPATSGNVRLSNGDTIKFRNAGNTANISLSTGSSDSFMSYGGNDLVNSGNTQTVTGIKTFSTQLIGAGTATNDSAAAGIIGEVLSISRVQSAATSVTTATTLNVTASSLSLTAGDWDLEGCIDFLPDATTSVTKLFAAISKTSATLPAADTYAVPTAGEVRQQLTYAAMVPTDVISIPLTRTRVSISSTTSFFLVARANFSVSTMTTYGSLTARRVR